MQVPLSQAAQDLGLMPNPNATMDEATRRRQKERGTAADDNPVTRGDNAFSAAVMDLLKGAL